MRLWELENGDGDDVGIDYAGGVGDLRPEELADPDDAEGAGVVAMDEGIPEQFADIVGLNGGPEEQGHVAQVAGNDPGEPIQPQAQAAPIPQPQHELQREGPLVLRINQAPRQPAPAAPAVPEPPQRRLRNRGPAQNHPVNGNVAPRVNLRQARRNRAEPDQGQRVQPGAEDQVAARQAWVQMFVEMALNDQEDMMEWDSEDEEDAGAWEIPVR